MVWAIMEKRIEKMNPKTIEELKQCISDVWDGLTWQTINGLIRNVALEVFFLNTLMKFDFDFQFVSF